MRLLFLILMSTVISFAGSIEDFAKQMKYETVYEKAVSKAKKEGKDIMLVMVTHYCPWCRKFERDTLSKKSINKLVSKKYVKLILNREKRQFPDKFDTLRIPTTFFISSKNEKLIYKEMGYKTKKEFLEMETRAKH